MRGKLTTLLLAILSILMITACSPDTKVPTESGDQTQKEWVDYSKKNYETKVYDPASETTDTYRLYIYNSSSISDYMRENDDTIKAMMKQGLNYYNFDVYRGTIVHFISDAVQNLSYRISYGVNIVIVDQYADHKYYGLAYILPETGYEYHITQTDGNLLGNIFRVMRTGAGIYGYTAYPDLSNEDTEGNMTAAQAEAIIAGYATTLDASVKGVFMMDSNGDKLNITMQTVLSPDAAINPSPLMINAKEWREIQL